MDNAIASLAVLKVNWDYLKKDYIENFIPFIATLIKKYNYGAIDVNTICNDFRKEFGLVIPYHPMCTILARAQKRGLIDKSYDTFKPNKNKVAQFDFTRTADEQIRKQEKIIKEFIDFAKREYSVELTKEGADAAFISFLKDHDLDILFASHQSTVLPPIKPSNEKKFLIYKFIKDAHESEPQVFEFIVDIAVGYILASAILYDKFNKFAGKLRKINFYFDTRCILRLIGAEGKEKKDAYMEFFKTLLEEKGNLFIFQHTYDEIMGILEDALRRVGSPLYDPSLASPVLRYFVENNYKSSDVERFIVNADSVLQENKIIKVDAPDPNKYKYYQIDEEKLYGAIVEIYKEQNPSFKELEKRSAIQRDVKSIASIYKLRKGRKPKTIKEADSIFATTNSGLSYANKRFESSEIGEDHNIPACLTDIFIGTLIWLQSPAKVLSLNEKKIIADCYAALQPNDTLIKKFLNEVEKLKGEKKISDDEHYLLRTHRVAMELLEEKTMGDPNNFTDKTSEEILEEIREGIKKEGEEKYLKEKEHHGETLSKLDTTEKEKEGIERNIEKRAEKISAIFGKILFVILVIIFILGTAAQFFPDFLNNQRLLRVPLILITFLFGLLSVATGFNIKGLRDKIKIVIKNKIISWLIGENTDSKKKKKETV